MGTVIALIAGLLGGFGGAYIVLKNSTKKETEKLVSDAEKEAEQIKKDKILQAKEKFFQLKSEHEKEILAKKWNNDIEQYLTFLNTSQEMRSNKEFREGLHAQFKKDIELNNNYTKIIFFFKIKLLLKRKFSNM